MAGRTSTAVGPLVFGSIFALMLHWYLAQSIPERVASQNAMYWAIGSVLFFLALGWLVLLRVRQVTAQEPLRFG